MENNEILRVENLTIKTKTFELLHDSSFSTNKSQIVLIQGANGSGKTSILKAIMGFHERKVSIDSCKVFYKGELINHNNINEFRKKIAYVEQEDFFTARTPYEYVKQSLLLSRNPNEKIIRSKLKETVASDEEKIVNLFKHFHKESIMFKRFSTPLSGGELRITSLMAAFIRDSDLYILDEPINKLDYKTAAIVGNYISDLSARGASVLVITHCRMFMKSDKAYEIYENTLKKLEKVPLPCRQ
ncbi:MAG: ATP-binding cassette domain-containing protein [Candidatus Cloacimonetes bacterium]|nr:ATP-binding cassette domain-containing protein [Candidatus Cloacimonadota bacterium]